MVSSIDNKAEHMLRLVPTDFVCERNAHTLSRRDCLKIGESQEVTHRKIRSDSAASEMTTCLQRNAIAEMRSDWQRNDPLHRHNHSPPTSIN